jgi:hypothetical protein
MRQIFPALGAVDEQRGLRGDVDGNADERHSLQWLLLPLVFGRFPRNAQLVEAESSTTARPGLKVASPIRR